jgi:predicted PurR-regulated permease PerM
MTAPGGSGDGRSRSRSHSRVPAWTLGWASLLLGAALLWQVLPLLNPVLLWMALAALLFPLRESPAVASVLWTLGAIALFWLLRELGAILAPFVVAVVLAYILNPAVDRIAALPPLRRLGGAEADGRTARSLAVVLLALPMVAGVVGGVVWGGPWLMREVGDLVRRTPEFLAWVSGMATRIQGTTLFETLDERKLMELFEQWGQGITGWLAAGALGVGRGVGLLLTLVGYLVLTPVLLFYLMRDWDHVLARVARRIPPSRRWIVEFGADYDRALAAYLRGQVTVSVLVGGMTAVGLLVVGFPFALLLGLVVALFNVVPYLGVILSLIPALGLALTLPDPGVALLKVAIVYSLAQGLESAVFSPRIVGDSTGLHPVWILLAISVSGFFFGFVGLLLAVPGAVAIKLPLERSLPGWGEERYDSTPDRG